MTFTLEEILLGLLKQRNCKERAGRKCKMHTYYLAFMKKINSNYEINQTGDPEPQQPSQTTVVRDGQPEGRDILACQITPLSSPPTRPARVVQRTAVNSFLIGSLALTRSTFSSPLVQPRFFIVRPVAMSQANLSDDGNSNYLWNVDRILPDFTELREPEISLQDPCFIIILHLPKKWEEEIFTNIFALTGGRDECNSCQFRWNTLYEGCAVYNN